MVCFGEWCVDCLLRLVLISPVQAGVSCMWTNDSQRLLLEHFDIIHGSPSQLYHSALPFCPSSSWLHEYYSLELSQEVKVVKGLLGDWGLCSCIASLRCFPSSLSCWDNAVAVGFENSAILILDAITGSQTSILSGHTDGVTALTFSSNGTSLVSGSKDKTVKLWDMQTGGIVKTFHGHTGEVSSVSISADDTTIASGSGDNTLRLWDIQKGECHQIIEDKGQVNCVMFSPKSPQSLISVSCGIVQQWDIDGHKVGPTYSGHHAVFSSDGILFILGAGDDATVHNTNSGLAVTKLHIAKTDSDAVPCFSPDHKLVAVGAGWAIHVWDITGSHPHLVGSPINNSYRPILLAFSSLSTLISASWDGSVKFWQIGASSTGPIVTNPESTLLTPAPTKSTALQQKNGLIIPNDIPDGVVQTWGILTGLHNGSLQTEGSYPSNIQLIDNKLIFVWYADEKINIWDAEKGELLHTINVPEGSVKDLKVSGDGTKLFCVYEESIQAWDIWTGEAVGKVRAQDVNIEDCKRMDFEGTEGSKIWAVVWESDTGFTMGWDFGIPGSPPVLFSSGQAPPDRLHLNDNKVWEAKEFRIKDIITGKVVFQLPERFGRFGRSMHAQWDGHYLVLESGVVIVDFSNVSL